MTIIQRCWSTNPFIKTYKLDAIQIFKYEYLLTTNRKCISQEAPLKGLHTELFVRNNSAGQCHTLTTLQGFNGFNGR